MTGVNFELVRCREEKVGHSNFRGRKRFSFRAIVLTDGRTDVGFYNTDQYFNIKDAPDTDICYRCRYALLMLADTDTGRGYIGNTDFQPIHGKTADTVPLPIPI